MSWLAYVAALVGILTAGVFLGRMAVVDARPVVVTAPNCEPAWSRAELAADLLGDCRQALVSCQSRGGGR